MWIHKRAVVSKYQTTKLEAHILDGSELRKPIYCMHSIIGENCASSSSSIDREKTFFLGDPIQNTAPPNSHDLCCVPPKSTKKMEEK
jgi:hypothetical protein